MSLEAILLKIQTEANQKAEAIREAAEKEKNTALANHTRELEAKQSRAVERIRSGIEEERKRREFHVRRESARKLMNARRAMMDKAIGKAAVNLASAPDAEYLEMISSLLAGCDLIGKVEVVISSADESRITAGYLAKHSSDDCEFVLSEERHEKAGGVIFKSGKISQNGTFPMIAELAHEDMVMMLSDLIQLEKN
ncbi:MAG: V-type ATP synthase subunit E family protein [Candidatus Fermentibacteria bacterium]